LWAFFQQGSLAENMKTMILLFYDS